MKIHLRYRLLVAAVAAAAAFPALAGPRRAGHGYRGVAQRGRLASGLKPLLAQQTAQHAATCKRMFAVQFIQAAPEPKIDLARRLRQVLHRFASDWWGQL